MSKKKCWIVVVVLLLIFLISDSIVLAFQDSEETRKTLRGIQGVLVVVEEINPELAGKGLSTSQIQTDVELKLRMAGIKVLSKDEFARDPASPILSVLVNISTVLHQPLIVFSVTINVVQDVFLARDLKKTTAATWSADNRAGIVGQEGVGEIRNYIKDPLDDFISAYLSVNQKK